MTNVTPRLNVHPDHLKHKRVSFGSGNDGEVAEETFVYEQDTSTYLNNGSTASQTKKQKIIVRNCSATDEPPTRVLVTGEWTSAPEALRPPVNREGYPLTTMADGVPFVTAPGHHGDTPHVVFSSPLPTIQHSMDTNQHENPFRPEGELNHIVDPIVEAYKRKPYGHLEEGDLSDGGGTSPSAESPLRPQPPHRPVVAEAPVTAAQVRVDLAVDGQTRAGNLHTATLEPPKAGKVELVHLDEKKKKCCHCCVVQ